MLDNSVSATRTSVEVSRAPALGEFFSLAGRSAVTLTVLYCVLLVPVLLGARGLERAGIPDGATALRVVAVVLGAPFLLGVGVLQALARSEGRKETLRESASRSVDRLVQSLGLLLLVGAACGICIVPVVIGEAAMTPDQGVTADLSRKNELRPGGEVPDRTRNTDHTSAPLSGILLFGSVAAGASILVCAGPVIGAFYRRKLGPIEAARAGFELSSGRRVQVGKIVFAAAVVLAAASIALGIVGNLVPQAVLALIVVGGALAYVLACALCAATYRFLVEAGPVER